MSQTDRLTPDEVRGVMAEYRAMPDYQENKTALDWLYSQPYTPTTTWGEMHGRHIDAVDEAARNASLSELRSALFGLWSLGLSAVLKLKRDLASELDWQEIQP